MFENSNVGSDHQQLMMQVMQSVARRYGLVCLLHEKPFAGVNGSGKHNNWSMGTDTGHNLMEPGRHAGGEHELPVLLRGGDPGRQQAPGPAAGVGREHRPGPPPGRQRGAAGDHLDLPRRRAREGVRGDRDRRGRPAHPGLLPGARRVGPAAAADARRRPQPHLAVRVHRQQVRVPRGRLERLALVPEHGPEHDRRRGDRRARRQARGEGHGRRRRGGRRDRRRVVHRQQGDLLRRRQLRRGLARGGGAARAQEPAHDSRRAARGRLGADGRDLRQVQRALRARARVALRGLARAVRHPGEHRGRDDRGDRPDADRAGGAASTWR